MRAARFDKTGDLSYLTVQEVETPIPGADEVLVKVAAAAINPSDVKNVQGMMAQTTLPRTPGRDFAGTVEQGPDDLRGVEVWGTGGDLGFVRDGTHAEYILLPRNAVRRRPAALFPEEAAAVGVPFVTAGVALLEAGGLTSEDTVIVVGAAGAVGSAAVQIARWKGARTWGVIRQPSQEQDVTEAGAQVLVNSEAGTLADAIRAATDGRGADLIFDTVGGALLEPCLNGLAIAGRLIEIAAPQGRVEFDLLDFYRRALTLRGVNTFFYDCVAAARILEQFTAGFESHALRPPRIARSYRLEEAPDAFAQVGSGHAGGKIVLVP